MSKKLMAIGLATAIGLLLLIVLGHFGFSFPGFINCAIVGLVSASLSVVFLNRR